MEVIEIGILQTKHRGDNIVLEVDIPEGTFPWIHNTTLRTSVTWGKGRAWCEKHFPGVPITFLEEK